MLENHELAVLTHTNLAGHDQAELLDRYTSLRCLLGQEGVHTRRILSRATFDHQVDVRVQRFQPLHVALVINSALPRGDGVQVQRVAVQRSMSLL